MNNTKEKKPIKFRAWDIRSSKMVYNALELSETQQLVTVNSDHFNSPFSFFDGCRWMQFIGLFDKNDKEIYDGDIIKVWNWGSTSSNELLSTARVLWDTDENGWSWINEEDSYSTVDNDIEIPCRQEIYITERWRNVEVVGNIYENILEYTDLIPQ